MPSFVVGDIEITDPVAYETHVPRALATIARFGGRVIAGGGKVHLLEGGPMPKRIFIIEFPNVDAALGWYRSDEYQAALKIRDVGLARPRASARGGGNIDGGSGRRSGRGYGLTRSQRRLSDPVLLLYDRVRRGRQRKAT